MRRGEVIGEGRGSKCGAGGRTEEMDVDKRRENAGLERWDVGGSGEGGKTCVGKIGVKMGLSFEGKGGDIESGVYAAADTGAEELSGGTIGKLLVVLENEFGY